MAESTASKLPSDPDAIVEEYLRRIDAGEQIDREAYLAAHPEVAPALRSFFANEQLMRQWTAGDGAPAAKDTAPKDDSPTIAPKSVAAAALTGPAGSLTFPAMMGRYRLERELGRGAMGNVYLAHDTELDRPVALKIPKFTAADNQDLIARFLREARAAAVLAHPNICRVYDVNEHQGVRYIAMEYIEGKPLSAFIAGGNVQDKQAASVIRKLALGLAEAHQRNILHRDLKPDNILVNKQGEPVLTDFGLARETTRGKASTTQDGVILGSPAYMPPEQAAGNLSEMGPPSDIYSLGVVLYEMLTGEVPFRGSVVEVLASVLMKTPKTVREQKPDVDPGIAAICDKMMSKKAVDRYPTMMAVAQALGDWLRTGGQQQPATTTKLPEPPASGDFKLADPKSKLAAGPHVVEPKKIPGVNDKPKQTIVPGTSKQTIQPKVPERTEKQINELADLGDQLLARFDYPEAIRLAEEIPDYQRTSALRKMLGEAYELKGKVEKLERNLEKYLNQLDLPELKKTVTALLKIHPGHPRGKEIKKALNTGGKKAVVQILKDEGNYDAVGSVWEPKMLAGGIAAIVVLAVIAYYAVTIYIEGQKQDVAITIDDPSATVKIDGKNTVDISGTGTGQIKLTLGTHNYTATSGETSITTSGSYTVTRDGKNVIEIVTKERQPAKPAARVGGTPPRLISPAAQAELSNGTPDSLGKHTWTFDWDDVPGATKYHIVVKGGNATAPIIDRADLTESRLQETLQGYIRPENGKNWTWKVRAQVAGIWYDWSEERRFHVSGPPEAPSADKPPLAVAPFDANQAKAHQEVWAKHLGVPVEYTNSIGMKFRLIPPGEYLMGAPDAEYQQALAGAETVFAGNHQALDSVRAGLKAETPQHRVKLTKPFYLAVHELTQSQYEQIMGSNPSAFAKTGSEPDKADKVKGIDTSNFPVERVNWFNAVEVCVKLSQAEQKTPSYNIVGKNVSITPGSGYRLPTEAEWEFACRAGGVAKFWFGDEDSGMDAAGWHWGNSEKRPHPVGEKQANPFGLFDMHGNLMEWCQDVWNAENHGAAGELAVDPLSVGTGDQRTIRSSWYEEGSGLCRSAKRGGATASWQLPFVGVRLALPIEAVKAAATAQAPPAAVAPFNAAQAKAHQEAWANYLGVPVEYTNSVGMKFRLIPPGEFLMGSADNDPDAKANEKPQHKVRITEPYYLGLMEVSQGQFKELMNKSPWKGKKHANDAESESASYIDWNDATSFCKKLSAKDGAEYFLPTEAQWEYAARAGSEARFGAGNTFDEVLPYAWGPRENKYSPYAGGLKKPNPFGLMDIQGNCWEWCADGYEDDYYAKSPGEDPTGASSAKRRSLRGSGFASAEEAYRIARREPTAPDDAADAGGFRVALRVVRPSASSTHEAGNVPPAAVAPFDPVQAKAHQEAWAKHLGVPVEYENSIGMKFRLIPPGEFLYGRTAEEIKRVQAGMKEDWQKQVVAGQGPAVKTVLSKPFYLAVHETTMRQFRRFVDATSYRTTAETSGKGALVGRPKAGFADDPQANWSNCYQKKSNEDLPVVCVTPADVHAMCAWLNQQEQVEYRLPTSEEWEFACRAGTTTLFWTGDNEKECQRHEWLGLGNAVTYASLVGVKSANPFGLFDMQGNVREWSENDNGRYQERSSFAGQPAAHAHSANRILTNADQPQSRIGFRLLLPVEAVTSATRK